MQENKVAEQIMVNFSVTPIFNFDKFKIKKLKKYDKQQLTSELMEELQQCLMNAITYNNEVK